MKENIYLKKMKIFRKKLYFQKIFFYYHTLYISLDINIIIKLLYIYLYPNYSIVCYINIEYN